MNLQSKKTYERKQAEAKAERELPLRKSAGFSLQLEQLFEAEQKFDIKSDNVDEVGMKRYEESEELKEDIREVFDKVAKKWIKDPE
jgi:hypothetical protein